MKGVQISALANVHCLPKAQLVMPALNQKLNLRLTYGHFHIGKASVMLLKTPSSVVHHYGSWKVTKMTNTKA